MEPSVEDDFGPEQSPREPQQGRQVEPHQRETMSEWAEERARANEKSRKRRMVIGLGTVALLVLGVGSLFGWLVLSGKAAVDEANSTMSLIAAGDAEAAYRSLAPECQVFPIEEMQGMVDYVDGGSYDFTNVSSITSNGETSVVVRGTISPPSLGERAAEVHMLKPDGDWKVCRIFVE